MILFSAVCLNAATEKTISRLQRGVAGARWRRADQLHITTAYFGDVTDDQAEELDRLLAIKPRQSFDITLEGADHFGQLPPHSLYSHARSQGALEALHKDARKAARLAGITMEARNYKPHLTLAYLKPDVDIDRLMAFERRLASFKSAPFLVDQMGLYSSHRRKKGGNAYRLEATYPLLGGMLR